MKKCRLTITKLLIVLISFFCIDGGRSLLLISNNAEVLLHQDHANDIEQTDQHNNVNLNDEVSWLELIKYDFSCLRNEPVRLLFTPNTALTDYPDSIWQPPKFF